MSEAWRTYTYNIWIVEKALMALSGESTIDFCVFEKLPQPDGSILLQVFDKKRTRIGSVAAKEGDENETVVYVFSPDKNFDSTFDKIRSELDSFRLDLLLSKIAKEIQSHNSIPNVDEPEKDGAAEPKKSPLPRVPKKGSKKYRRWQAIYKKTRGWDNQGLSDKQISNKLDGTELASSPEVIADILRAGNAKLLD